MANGNDLTKTELQDCLDRVTDILESAYTPEASRENLAAAIGDAWPTLKERMKKTMLIPTIPAMMRKMIHDSPHGHRLLTPKTRSNKGQCNPIHAG